MSFSSQTSTGPTVSDAVPAFTLPKPFFSATGMNKEREQPQKDESTATLRAASAFYTPLVKKTSVRAEPSATPLVFECLLMNAYLLVAPLHIPTNQCL